MKGWQEYWIEVEADIYWGPERRLWVLDGEVRSAIGLVGAINPWITQYDGDYHLVDYSFFGRDSGFHEEFDEWEEAWEKFCESMTHCTWRAG